MALGIFFKMMQFEPNLFASFEILGCGWIVFLGKMAGQFPT